MKGKPIQNLAASVYTRLLKRTEPGDEQFQFVLMLYGAERLMYRLSQSEHAANFVLKGAMLFLVWTGAQYRWNGQRIRWGSPLEIIGEMSRPLISPDCTLNGTLKTFTSMKNHGPVPTKASFGSPTASR